MNQDITMKQLLQICVNELNQISVPMCYKEQIADPIQRVINDLKVGIQAFETAEKEQAKPEVEISEPEIIKIGGEENE